MTPVPAIAHSFAGATADGFPCGTRLSSSSPGGAADFGWLWPAFFLGGADDRFDGPKKRWRFSAQTRRQYSKVAVCSGVTVRQASSFGAKVSLVSEASGGGGG